MGTGNGGVPPLVRPPAPAPGRCAPPAGRAGFAVPPFCGFAGTLGLDVVLVAPGAIVALVIGKPLPELFAGAGLTAGPVAKLGCTC